jgi:hypothetical protein
MRSETRRRMAALMRRWVTSRDTQAVFAQRHGVSRAKLRYWLRRTAAAGTPPEARGFTAVRVVGTDADGDAGVEVVLPTGVRVIVRSGASEALVRRVVSALGGGC